MTPGYFDGHLHRWSKTGFQWTDDLQSQLQSDWSVQDDRAEQSAASLSGPRGTQSAEQMVQENIGWMLALARHVLGDRALADDPVQDVFQNAFRALLTVSFCSYGTSKNMTRTIFELHSRVCRECRDYLAAYRRTTEGRAAMLCPSDRVADDVPQVLIKAVLKSLR